MIKAWLRSLASRLRRRPRRRNRGYTVVEVMMALSVLSIGATGVVALQKVTLIGNTRARDNTTATMIGGSTLERLRFDGMKWRIDPATGLDTLNTTDYLDLVNTNPNTWTMLPKGGTGNGLSTGSTGFEPTYDIKGGDSATELQFCVHYRLVPLINGTDDAGGFTAPLTVMRADVRVMWLRNWNSNYSQAGVFGGALCDVANVALHDTQAVTAIRKYHYVYMSTLIARSDR